MDPEIEQNTPEWLELRRKHIGASDAPIIMGDSPWKTEFQLWEEKLGMRSHEKMNEAMKRGHDLEPVAREAYNNYTGLCVEPEVVFHPNHKWMMASLDGLSLDRSMVVEIKCPGQKDHDEAKAGSIPEKYYAQLQHQLETIGLDVLHYFSFRDGDFSLIEVERDNKYIQLLYKKELDFWKNLQNFQAPLLSDRDYSERSDNTWINAAQEWASVNAQLVELKKEENKYRDQLIQLSSDQNCQGGGIKVKKVVRKGTVNYKSIPELSEVELEKYRGAPVESWRLTCS